MGAPIASRRRRDTPRSCCRRGGGTSGPTCLAAHAQELGILEGGGVGRTGVSKHAA